MKILFSWIGNRDVENAIQDKDAAISRTFKIFPQDMAILLCDFPSDNFQNHIKYLSTHRKEQEKNISYLEKNWNTKAKSYIEWIKQRTTSEVKVKFVNLSSPTNHSEIYKVCIAAIKEIKEKYPDCELTYQVTSGTPSMHAIWILIAKSMYPADLVESSPEGGVKKVIIPFEITAKFVEELDKYHKSIYKKLTFEDVEKDPAFKDIFFKSNEMLSIYNLANRIAQNDIPVYIEGESGTGKEVLAEFIHKKSKRSKKKLITINCGAIQENLIESELFGYIRGAFTGADKDKKGLFEVADGGTVFLDEVAELPLSVQVKLLRVLQKGKFTKVGDTKEIEVDVRIISATNKNLASLVAKKLFREDLYYRLVGSSIKILPLRERPEDLKILIEIFINRHNHNINESGLEQKQFTKESIDTLLNFPWHGNVRELDHAISGIIVGADTTIIAEKEVKKHLNLIRTDIEDILLNYIPNDFSFDKIFEKIYSHYFSMAESIHPDNKTKRAQILGLKSYQSMDEIRKKYLTK